MLSKQLAEGWRKALPENTAQTLIYTENKKTKTIKL
jgi:hypothetical protein